MTLSLKKIVIWAGIAIAVAIAGAPILHGLAKLCDKVAGLLPTWS